MTQYRNGFIFIIVMYVASFAISMVTGQSFTSGAIIVIIGTLAFILSELKTKEGR